jgi:hypothetical protein
VQTLNPTHRRPVEAGNRVFGRCAGEKVAVVRGDGRRRARGVIMSRLALGLRYGMLERTGLTRNETRWRSVLFLSELASGLAGRRR